MLGGPTSDIYNDTQRFIQVGGMSLFSLRNLQTFVDQVFIINGSYSRFSDFRQYPNACVFSA